MNAPSEDIKDMLAAESSLGLTFGTDLHVHKYPESPDQLVSVQDTGGYDPIAQYVYDKPTVQVIVRGGKGTRAYTTAWALAKGVRDALHAKVNETWNGTRYIAIYSVGDILDLGEDENSRPLLSLNFRIDRTA